MKSGNNIFMGIFVALGFVLMCIFYFIRTAFFLLPILIPIILVVMVIYVVKRNRDNKTRRK